MRKLFIITVGMLLALSGVNAQTLITGHVDITFTYAASTWQSEFRHGGTPDDPTVSTPIDQAALPAIDQPYISSNPASGGDRRTQPNGTRLDFTGVPDGEPVWAFLQSNPADTWPGFRNSQPASTFKSYDPGDERVDVLAPTAPSQPWLKVALKNVTYIGQSPSAEFSMWQVIGSGQGTVFLQWMSTFENGIDATDCYYFLEQAHTHINWGFSQLGIYRITLEATATLLNGTVVTSSPNIVTFAIGTLATYQADHYSGSELENLSLSGPLSDSDQDGLELILEYAFNLVPTLADAKTMVPSTGTSGLPVASVHTDNTSNYLRLEFIRRKSSTNPQITYTPEFADTPDAESWSSGVMTSQSSIDSTWERVVYTDSVAGSPNSPRFGRVRVNLLEKIAY